MHLNLCEKERARASLAGPAVCLVPLLVDVRGADSGKQLCWLNPREASIDTTSRRLLSLYRSNRAENCPGEAVLPAPRCSQTLLSPPIGGLGARGTLARKIDKGGILFRWEGARVTRHRPKNPMPPTDTDTQTHTHTHTHTHTLI